jgi:hypothetical protein
VQIDRTSTETDIRKDWINIVHKHRPGIHPTAISCLCSAQFENTCFDVNLASVESFSMKSKIESKCFPVIHFAGIVQLAAQEHAVEKLNTKTCWYFNTIRPQMKPFRLNLRIRK